MLINQSSSQLLDRVNILYKALYSLYVLFSQWRSQGNFTLCLLCIHMHLNDTKFERNSPLEYYHMICIGRKQNIQAKEVYWNKRKFCSRIYRLLSFMSLQGGSTLRSNPFFRKGTPFVYIPFRLPWKMVRLLLSH